MLYSPQVQAPFNLELRLEGKSVSIISSVFEPESAKVQVHSVMKRPQGRVTAFLSWSGRLFLTQIHQMLQFTHTHSNKHAWVHMEGDQVAAHRDVTRWVCELPRVFVGVF